MATNEDLLYILQNIDNRMSTIDNRLEEHIKDEQPVLHSAQHLIDQHGDRDEVTARIQFINGWMEREKDRKALRKAIIEKTLVGAIWALLLYLAIAVRHDLVDWIQSNHSAAKEAIK